jgi:hypothetical protein
MTMSGPEISNRQRVECLKEVGACIAEAEVATSATAATVKLLARTGFDTSEAVQGLWVDMDALTILRNV